MLIITTFFIIALNAQQTVVIQNSESQIVKENSNFSINGISSTFDIGGVEACVTTKFASRYQGSEIHKCYVSFRNYNHCSVTVLYQVGSEKTTGSVVLKPSEEKTQAFGTVTTGYGGDIPASTFNVFTITRKL